MPGLDTPIHTITTHPTSGLTSPNTTTKQTVVPNFLEMTDYPPLAPADDSTIGRLQHTPQQNPGLNSSVVSENGLFSDVMVSSQSCKDVNKCKNICEVNLKNNDVNLGSTQGKLFLDLTRQKAKAT